MNKPYLNLYERCKNRIDMLEKQGYAINSKELIKELDAIDNSFDKYIEFAKKLIPTEKRADFGYTEPDDYKEILAERPDGCRDVLKSYISETELKDKTYGGVFGRFVGCMLGKPFEMGLEFEDIKKYLESANAWPLNDYVPQYSRGQKLPLRRDCAQSMNGLMSYAQPDDDINYTILGLRVLEKYGQKFTSQEMAKLWIESVPFGWSWSAEHTFYYLVSAFLLDHDAELPEKDEFDMMTRLFNDGEECIGAMIRADSFGLTSPMLPKKAAEFAYRDGVMTHKKTGLYAEMWTAATIAAAYSTFDPVEAVKIGIEQIPSNSRYAKVLCEALDIALSESDWIAAYERINAKWGHLGHAGTLNESAAIINALVHSVGDDGIVDVGKAVCITIMHGWDTDCSGATAGCIAGVLAGKHSIEDRWLQPLCDTYYSCVAGEVGNSVSALAERMYQMSRIVRG